MPDDTVNNNTGTENQPENKSEEKSLEKEIYPAGGKQVLSEQEEDKKEPEKEPEKEPDKEPEKEPEKKTEEGEPEKKEVKEPENKEGDDKPPEKYDLKLPKDSPLEQSVVDRITEEAKKYGLSQDYAQHLIDREHNAVVSYVEAQKEALLAKSEAWVEEIKSDKELGGENFAKNAELAKRVVNRFGTEAFNKTLNDTGLGNHPELMRTFVKIGQAMSEDQLVIPGSQTPPKTKDIASTLYDNTQ